MKDDPSQHYWENLMRFRTRITMQVINPSPADSRKRVVLEIWDGQNWKELSFRWMPA